jgi:LysR family hydrogen peroxide-inducible transcriptional activator
MIPLPSPQQLRYLIALAETQHFGRAAAACAVTQSTLSAGLIALERQLDSAILDRCGGKRVVFTPLGHDLLARARQAMAALQAVVETAEAARAPMSGRLRLGVIPTLGPFLLPRLMPALRAAFPRIEPWLREDQTDRLLEQLAAGRLDLLLLALPCDCAGNDTLSVVRDEFLVALPVGHRLATQDRIPVRALQGERLLLLEDGHCLRDQALAVCDMGHGGNKPGDEFSATSLHTLVQMVASGLGVTLLPRIAIDAGITTATDIALRPLAGRGGWRTIGLTWRPNTPRAADFRLLAPLLADAATAQPMAAQAKDSSTQSS